MTLIELKNNFHNLIDNLSDMELLKNFYDGLSLSAEKSLLKELSEEGKKKSYWVMKKVKMKII